MTVYVLLVDYLNGGPEVVCGVFTSEEAALKYTSDRYSYRTEKYVLDAYC